MGYCGGISSNCGIGFISVVVTESELLQARVTV